MTPKPLPAGEGVVAAQLPPPSSPPRIGALSLLRSAQTTQVPRRMVGPASPLGIVLLQALLWQVPAPPLCDVHSSPSVLPLQIARSFSEKTFSGSGVGSET